MTDEVKKYIEKSVLCWLATTDGNGDPNVSPKEIFLYGGNKNIIIANIASPNSVKNILLNPKVCVSFIDVFEQQGFKVKGTANVIKPGDNSFEEYLGKLRELADERFPIKGIIEVNIEKTTPIKAPSYFLFPDLSLEQQIQSGLKTYGVSKINV